MTSNRVLAAALAVLVTGLVVIGLTIAGVFSDGSSDTPTATERGAGDSPFGVVDPGGDGAGEGGGADAPTAEPSATTEPTEATEPTATTEPTEPTATTEPTEPTEETEPNEAPSPGPADPSTSSDDADGSDSDPAGSSEVEQAASVIASADGVVRRVAGRDTQVTDARARAAYGVDDLVAYEVRTGRGDSRASRVRVWSPREDRRLVLGDGATQMRLLGGGALAGRPVALVTEYVPGEEAQDVTDRLVAVDLRDGSRTVFADGDVAFESGWTSAHLLPDGDVVATRQSQVVVTLVRLTGDGEQRWQTRVAEDREASLAALGRRLWIVGPPSRAAGNGEDGAGVRTLRVATYDAADGSRTTRDRIALDEALAPQVRCQDWLTTTQLVCATGAEPAAVTARDASIGSVERLEAPPGAVVTAVATTG